MPRWYIVLAYLVLFYGVIAVVRLGIFQMPAPPVGPGDGEERLCRTPPYGQWYHCEGSVRDR